jgi:hypothetical protein
MTPTPVVAERGYLVIYTIGSKWLEIRREKVSGLLTHLVHKISYGFSAPLRI